MRRCVCILAALLAGPPDRAAAEVPADVRVGRWDRFEATIANPKRYADPYRDVTLNVTYTGPDGSQVEFWGFHDGGTAWKFRFMPDRVGPWRYAARFSDGAPGASGGFTCVHSDLPGRIGADEANPQWFGFKGGRPVLIRGLHIGDRFVAANWDAARRTAFLDWAQKQGYNTLSIASHFLNRAAPGRGQGWDTPALWPLSSAEYQRMEAVLDDLARRRIIVFPFAGFFGQKSNYPRDPADQELYIRYTLARLGSYWNLLWNVAGPEPNLKPPREWMASAEVERLGRLIGRLDPFGHLISVHNRTGDDPYRDSDWTTYGVLQGPKTVDRRRLSRGLLESHHPRKPLLAQETLWSDNVNHIRAIGRDYTDDDLRKNTWVIHMSAAALVFADNAGDSSTGFTGTLDLADRRQDRHDAIRPAWDYMATVPFGRTRPRQDLVDTGYCLADPGRQYFVYLESPGPVNVRVEGGPYAVEWVNGKNVADRRPGGKKADGRGLTPPPGGDDWLLCLTAEGPAQAAPAPEKVTTGAYPDLVVDAAGGVHLVYARNGRLFHRQRDPGTGAWSVEQDTGVAAADVHRSDSDVVTDSKNQPHVLAGSGYAWRDNGRWRVIDPGVARDTSLAIDSRDTVYVVRRGGHGDGFLGLRVRRAGAKAFEPLPDPDVANGLPKGRNDHVYAHLAIRPVDDSLHVVYRHGLPQHCAYRTSADGGRTWAGGGIADDDKEAPSAAVGPDGAVYAVTGSGQVFRRGRAPTDWQSLGRALDADRRDQPVLAAIAGGRMVAACFGGKINVYADGKWAGQTTLPAPSGKPLGFADLAAAPGGTVYAVWEEGPKVHNDEPAGESDILFAPVRLPPAPVPGGGSR